MAEISFRGTWLEFVDNPAAVSSTFGVPPSLSSVRILSLKFLENGPTAKLNLAINDYPSQPLPRWNDLGANAVTMAVTMFGTDDVRLSGWSLDNIVTVGSERQDTGRLLVVALGGPFVVSLTCLSLRVDGFTPYHRVSATMTEKY